jgi:hypothetical protein
MASSSKKKTTMAKLMRESKLRERRLDKQARKDARKLASAHGAENADETPDAPNAELAEPDESAERPVEQPLDPIALDTPAPRVPTGA